MVHNWYCAVKGGELPFSKQCCHTTCASIVENVEILSTIMLSNQIPKNCIILPKPPNPFTLHTYELDNGSWPCLINNCEQVFCEKNHLLSHLRNIHQFSTKFLETVDINDLMWGGGSAHDLAGGSRPTLHKQGWRTVYSNGVKTMKCEYPNCSTVLRTKKGIEDHIKKEHWAVVQNFCSYCRAGFDSLDILNLHKQTVHYSNDSFSLVEECHEDKDRPGVFNKGAYVKSFKSASITQVDQVFDNKTRNEVKDLCDMLAGHSGTVMISPSIHIFAAEMDQNGERHNLHRREIYTPGHSAFFANAPDHELLIRKFITGLQTATEQLEQIVGSGFSVVSIEALKLNYDKKDGLRAAKWIPSAHLSHKKSMLNIKNTSDNFCLLYCIAAHLFPMDSKLRIRDRENPKNYRKHFSIFNLKGLTFPLQGPSEIKTFFSQNTHLKTDLTVYKNYGNKVYPIFSTVQSEKSAKNIHHVRVLEIEGFLRPTKENPVQESTSHYVLITNFNSFMRIHYETEKSSTTSNSETCPICCKFSTRLPHIMNHHQENCAQSDTGQTYEFPEEGERGRLKFKKTRACFRPALIGAADFETTLSPESVCGACKLLYLPHLSQTEKEHMVCYHTSSVCTKIDCQYKKECEHRQTLIQSNLDAVAHFGVVTTRDKEKFDSFLSYNKNAGLEYLQHLLDNEKKFTDYLSINIPRKPLTTRQKTLYYSQPICGEKGCRVELDRSKTNPDREKIPVIDHCHLRYANNYLLFNINTRKNII